MVKEVFYSELKDPHRQIGSLASITPNRRGAANMKKYYQAALIAVALLSLVSLLFYRHEYNRLRYVLEVLNFYGKPGTKEISPIQPGGDLFTPKLGVLFNSPLPAWQRLNDELFIYSAHSFNNNQVRALAFGKVYDNLNMDCSVFFEGKAPVSGVFKQSEIHEISEYTGYQLVCEFPPIGIPEFVAFFNKEPSGERESVILNVRNSLKNLMTKEIALCVAPPMNRSISRTDLISFLNFHQIIGVANFIVYDNGISNRFLETVKDIMTSQGLNFTLAVIPWNFPFVEFAQEDVKEIIERDCLYRTYNEVEYSATLHWEEYMVLKYHHNLLELLNDVEKTKKSVERFVVQTNLFCTQQEDDKDSTPNMPTILRKTNKVSLGKSREIRISKPQKSIDFDNVEDTNADADIINVNEYQYCSNLRDAAKSVKDTSILRFINDLIDAPIYKEFVTRQSSSRK